jgi:hypothetical protein
VSYTFFLGQVNANNVQTVTSTGDAIQGTFRHQVAYPPGTADARQVEQFTTAGRVLAGTRTRWRRGVLGHATAA